MHDQPTDIPYGYCHCGCGAKTRLSSYSCARKGWVKGEPRRFLPQHHAIPCGPEHLALDCGHETPCWVWQRALNVHGYAQFGSSHSPGGRGMAYRRNWEAKHGPVPAGLELDHLCRNRACVNPDHLEPVTRAENARRGASTKLTPSDVRAIRSSTETARALGRQFGVSRHTIAGIRARQTWADLT